MMTPAALVACNIYVTAAASHSSTLISLLKRAQDQCRQLRLQDDRNLTENDTKAMMAPVAIIHAYADIPYDRSSFHLAGTADCVSDVASTLICNALNEIDLDCISSDGQKSGEVKEARHPFVGLVDHVSVMPLEYPANNNGSSDVNDSKASEAAAKAAREIGEHISETNFVNVHYYGSACPRNTSLATVRREMTSFFKSGGAIDKDRAGQNKDEAIVMSMALKGDATVGTPQCFVENFNIRLTSNVDFEQAKTLTQFLRGRNISTKGYGVAGVEGLTLPYVRSPSEGGNVYEVACNLTNPKKGGSDQIRVQLDKWIGRQKQQLDNGCEKKKTNYKYFVEDAYRVGTTEEQCVNVLSGKICNKQADFVINDVYWEKYDQELLSKFQQSLP